MVPTPGKLPFIARNAPGLRLTGIKGRDAGGPFSWKHFHSAGAFAVCSGRFGFHWFRFFLVGCGLAHVEVDRLLQLEQKGSQGLVAGVQAIAYRRTDRHSFLVRVASLG